MTKLKHQERLYKLSTNCLCRILTDKEFTILCDGDGGYWDWDDNYFCIIEQQLGEELE